jgi:PAS domain S-box-containing protein
MTSSPTTLGTPDWQAIAFSLAGEPALQPFARNGAILLWSVDGQTLLYANATGQALAGAQADAIVSPASARLRLLGTGLAPRNGVRLERLRLLPGSAGSLLTCACRLVADGFGGEVLLTALSAQELRRIGLAEKAAEMRTPESPVASRAVALPGHVVELVLPTALRPLRFTWECDAAGHISKISSIFASFAGETVAANLIGRNWSELLATSVLEEKGAVTAALTQTETWSGHTVLWQLADPDKGRPVQLSAMPIWHEGVFAGFRGFGVLKTEPDQPFRRPVAEVARVARPEAGTSSVHMGRLSTEAPSNPIPTLSEVPSLLRDSVVPLRLPRATPLQTLPAESSPETVRPTLSPVERNAFREIAQALGARIDHDMRQPPAGVPLPALKPEPQPETAVPIRPAHAHNAHADLLDRLPIAVLVRREGRVIYANRTLLDLLDYADIDDLNAAGGANHCISGTIGMTPAQVTLVDRQNDHISVDARADEIIWKDEPATLLSFRRATGETGDQPRLDALLLDVAARDARLGEMTAMLDTATDGVVTVDERGRILSLNKSAEALFGFDQREVTGDLFTLLLAPESHTRALDYLEGLKGGGVASVLNDGREVMGRVRQGGRITLFMTMGQIAQGASSGAATTGNGRKFCAVLRDITSWKKTELELVEARKQAERASAQKSDVLAKISHEIRTPLNAIIGFSEVMAEERFGPIGNERYKEYLRDIHESGGYVISLVNDLLDLAKIEAGKLDLDFVSVNLNEIATSCVALLQPEAQRGRVVLRSGLSPKLPPVVADERSIRQILINVLSNAVKFTDAGGQVIVSSALGDKGEAIIRVRDTGIGMTEADLKLALEPFRQVQSTRKAGGTGLGLPLTKALVEANRASLAITSARNEGTLIEITFPPQRVLAS